jgi:hypothetical protein
VETDGSCEQVDSLKAPPSQPPKTLVVSNDPDRASSGDLRAFLEGSCRRSQASLELRTLFYTREGPLCSTLCLIQTQSSTPGMVSHVHYGNTCTVGVSMAPGAHTKLLRLTLIPTTLLE